MALTIEQKSSVRRHLIYPVGGLYRISPAGGTLASGAAGWRFFQAYSFLEHKMNNLMPDEEARLTGAAFGAIALTGLLPNEGDQISVTLYGGGIASPQTITVSMPNLATIGPDSDGRLVLMSLLANAVSSNSVLQAAGVLAVQPYGTGPFAQNAVPFPQCAFEAPMPFSITASGIGQYPQITAAGNQLPPSAPIDMFNPTTMSWGYLPILDGLENAHAGTTQNLDTKQAGPWHSRGNEIGLRTSLYRHWQQKLSDYLGTPINPNRMNHASTVGAVRYA